MSQDRRYQRAPHVLWRRTLDTVVLLPVTDEVGEPFVLAATGPELWELLREPQTIEALSVTLADRHGVEVATVTADVERTVDRLLALGAVVTSPG